MIYPDTSFLFSLYVDEVYSPLADEYAVSLDRGVAFTPFHRLELRMALRGRAYRKEIDSDGLRDALRRSETHLVTGFLNHTPLPWSDALREAERLGEAYVVEIGGRSADILHIASAVVLGAKEFVTFDQRQHALARRAGLKVKTWRSAK